MIKSWWPLVAWLVILSATLWRLAHFAPPVA